MRKMRRTLVTLGMLAMLNNCAMVNVYTQESDDVAHYWYPLGVRVESQSGGPGVRAEAKTFGLSVGCGAIGLGLSETDCTYVNPDVCGLAIYDGSGDSEMLIAAARKTFEHCQGG